MLTQPSEIRLSRLLPNAAPQRPEQLSELLICVCKITIRVHREGLSGLELAQRRPRHQ